MGVVLKDADPMGQDADRPVDFEEVLPLFQLADMMAPMAVRVAATLHLADHIAAGKTRLADLASAAGAHPEALRRLLRYLSARGVFAQPEPETYALTGLARVLLDEHPSRARSRYDLNGPTGRGDMSFTHLLHSIRSGGPSFEEMYGRSFWEDLDSDPRQAAEFAKLQAANIAHSGLESQYDWSQVRHVIDVGGGTGTLISQVLRPHSHLRGTIVDLPGTAEEAQKALAESGLAGRCDVHGGSFFDPLPAGADVYLLSKILHDWADDEALAILKRCAEAAGPGGRVLILEMTLTNEADENEAHFSYLDLHMLVYFGGKERTVAEFASLADAAGMDLKLVPVAAARFGTSVLECVVR